MSSKICTISPFEAKSNTHPWDGWTTSVKNLPHLPLRFCKCKFFTPKTWAAKGLHWTPCARQNSNTPGTHDAMESKRFQTPVFTPLNSKESFFVEMTLFKIQMIHYKFTLKIKEVPHPETNMDACCEITYSSDLEWNFPNETKLRCETAVHQNDLFWFSCWGSTFPKPLSLPMWQVWLIREAYIGKADGNCNSCFLGHPSGFQLMSWWLRLVVSWAKYGNFWHLFMWYFCFCRGLLL